jgi:hypothetical protein
MCANDDVETICLLNNICNDAGMDTISTGWPVAFAIECFENDVISVKSATSPRICLWARSSIISTSLSSTNQDCNGLFVVIVLLKLLKTGADKGEIWDGKTLSKFV